MALQIEVTDTFGGKANYSWVRHYKITDDTDMTVDQIIRRAKKAAGWSGVRCTTDNAGDMITLRPRGMCLVMFIHDTDPENLQGPEA